MWITITVRLWRPTPNGPTLGAITSLVPFDILGDSIISVSRNRTVLPQRELDRVADILVELQASHEKLIYDKNTGELAFIPVEISIGIADDGGLPKYIG